MPAAYGYDGASWREATELWAYDGGTWRDIQHGYVYDGTAWRKFWPGVSPCSTIDSAAQNNYFDARAGCGDPKCFSCVVWDLGCACIAGQVMDIFLSISGGSYSLVGSNISCTSSTVCTEPAGTWTGNWRSTICSVATRQHRVELMDTDTTTTLDTAYTSSAACGGGA